ncbi:hypothetical protein AOC19_04275 [Polynucleobacter asymbioticus]|uniref:hypothetical protein n=1 Tax=Polynucleobacter asymbioticus TaxID=576611 RepID=UPI001BFDC675|nr:hypothetical protein [Polynucleobacter asymbioticus]QWD86081.1 hypothetical protein AOC19_04275 [Polynucleobacter asymbioticus]
MPSAKNSKKLYAAKRDDPNGAVIVIPHYVLNSSAYKTLSGNAIRLMIDIAMQYNGRDNNGSLLASWRYMSERRGWTSAGSLKKALDELLEHQLIFKTVQGHRPNKASWFAICWVALQITKGIDVKVQDFPRGAYAHWVPSPETKLRRKMIPVKPLKIRQTHCQIAQSC